jgi:hypothetical protein
MDVAVKDNNEAVHNINTDVLEDGSETQAVKLQLGDVGRDGGYASQHNPVPVELMGFFRRLFLVFGRFSFDTASQLRTAVSGSVSISGTAATNVTTMTTGNIGIGDWGKLATAMEQSHLAFQSGIRRNFTKA